MVTLVLSLIFFFFSSRRRHTIWPRDWSSDVCSSDLISSTYGPRWGSFHRGIDFARPSNRDILASAGGVVESAGYLGSYGNRIVINHNNGYKTLYAHLSSINVTVGQTVSQGEKVGVMGSTGRTTGVNLHFEVVKNGSTINPMNVLN